MSETAWETTERVIRQWDNLIRGKVGYVWQSGKHIPYDDYLQEAYVAIWKDVSKHPERDWHHPSIGNLIPQIVGLRCANVRDGRAFTGEEGVNGHSTRANPLRPNYGPDRGEWTAGYIEDYRRVSASDSGDEDDAWEAMVAPQLGEGCYDMDDWCDFLDRILPDFSVEGRKYSRQTMRSLADLKYREGCTWGEADKILGLAKGTSGSTWTRARKIIKKYYEELKADA